MEKLKLEYWPVNRLRACARPLRDNDACVERMASAMSHFGCRIPLLVRADGEVVDGHLRLKAARALNFASVPVLLVETTWMTRKSGRSACWSIAPQHGRSGTRGNCPRNWLN